MAGVPGGGFTDRVRQEAQTLPLGTRQERAAELAGLLRTGGSLLRESGEALQWIVATTSGAVARRAHALMSALSPARPDLRVRVGVGGRRTFGVAVDEAAITGTVGLLDANGHLLRAMPEQLLALPQPGQAALRGLLLGGGSWSAPGRAPHLEVVASGPELANQIARLLTAVSHHPAIVADGKTGPRAVLKSRSAIGAVLVSIGASGAFVEWDDQQLRRDLRNEANRLANADAANLRRSSDAAAGQVRDVERALDAVGWDGLDDGLRGVALARLANPSASLAEIGEMCDPPVGKATVHRRLRQLAQLAKVPTGLPDEGAATRR